MFARRRCNGRRILWYLLFISLFASTVQHPASAQALERTAALGFVSTQDLPRTLRLSSRVDMNVANVPLDIALERLVQAGAPLVYSTTLVTNRGFVTCRCSNTPLRKVLDHILQGTGIAYRASATTGQIALIPVPLPAADGQPVVGSVRGRVLESAMAGPVVGAAVTVIGTARGAITDAAGRYFITNVPPGEQLIVASRIGLRPDSVRVTVIDDAVVDADFVLGVDPVTMNPLEATVTTGSMALTERKKIGNSMVVISQEEIQLSGARDLPELLRGRAPGVVVSRTSGANGTGGNIQIRGIGSIIQDQTPLIYVDGVPVDAGNGAIHLDGTGANVLGNNAPDRNRGNQLRIDELALGQVERIEIIKGAAATTLYGTQGANGVIQIFTKRGVPGQTRFTASIEQGVAKLRRGDDFGADVAYQDQFFAQFREPRVQEYQVGVSGGSGDISYSIGATHGRDEGYVPLNDEQRTSLTTSFRILASDKLSVSMSGTFTRREFQYADLFLGSNRTSLEAKLDTVMTTSTEVDRMYGSLAISYQPLSIWQNRLTIGIDDNSEANDRVGIVGNTGFNRDHITRDFRRTSANFVSTLSYPNTGPVTSTLSVGGEIFHDRTDRLRLRGQGFPNGEVVDFDLATTIMGGDAQSIPTDLRTKVAQLGGFIQEQFGIHDRLFITAGLRADGSSTFGDNFGMQIYPKLAASFILQPAAWWNAKLRSSWGQAGQAPPPFAKDLSFQLGRAVTGAQITLPLETLGDLGNPDLRPELNTEWEIGVENYFFGNRGSFELNYFRQNTRDAHIRAPVPLSSGVLAGPLANIGELRSEGLEAAIRYTAFQTQSTALDVGFTLTHLINNGLVTKLGDDPVLTRFNQGFPLANLEGLRVGFSVRDLYYSTLFDDTITEGFDGREIIRVGSLVPTTYGGANINLRFLDRTQLYANVIYNYGGHGLDLQRFNSDRALGYLGMPGTTTGYSRNAFPEHFEDRYVFRTDQVRLDLVRLLYQLPEQWVTSFARAAEIWVEGNNMLAWDAFPRGDPEGVPLQANASGITGFRGLVPPRPVMYKIGLRMTF